MKRLKFLLFFFCLELRAQSYELDTLFFSGDPDKFINLVILGDGYTTLQLDTFVLDAKNLSQYLFTQEPFSNYKNYFNVFAVKVESPESGVKHPNTAPDCQGQSAQYPVTNPNTFFSSTFDYAGIHRLVVPTQGNKAISILKDLLPQYDQIFIIANSKHYGGSGGTYATSTVHSSSTEVTVHEIGHSFSGLADEYYAGDGYARETYNMTGNTDPKTVRWSNWYGDFGIGIYQHCCGGNSANWFKPAQDCKMQALFQNFCEVCRQTIVSEIDRRTDAIVRYSPNDPMVGIKNDSLLFSLDQIMLPVPNTLKIDWTLNGSIMEMNKDHYLLLKNKLNPGINNISVTVYDTTGFLRIPNYSTTNFSKINWQIKNDVTGLNSQNQKDHLKVQMYRQQEELVVQLCVDNTIELLGISIYNINAFCLTNMSLNKKIEECEDFRVSINNFSDGIYLVHFKLQNGDVTIPINLFR